MMYKNLIINCFLFIVAECCPRTNSVKVREQYYATLNVTVKNKDNGVLDRYEINKNGARFLGKSIAEREKKGLLILAESSNGNYDGCLPTRKTSESQWIAYTRQGKCRTETIVKNTLRSSNATALIIFANKSNAIVNPPPRLGGVAHVESPSKMHDVRNNDEADFPNTVVLLDKEEGEKLANMLQNSSLQIYVEVSRSSLELESRRNASNKTSVLFVSISFIVLMIISLAWLVFYYIQRFRYAHAKERLSRRLMSAAKKAIGRMPVKTLRSADPEDQCAVCIEYYKTSEVVRTLPCHHVFHKSCIDPWLLEQRSCPMCKLDILKAYGFQVLGIKMHEPNALELDDSQDQQFNQSVQFQQTSSGVAHVELHAPNSSGEEESERQSLMASPEQHNGSSNC